MFSSLMELVHGLRDPFADATGIEYFREYLHHPSDEGALSLEVPGFSQVKTYSCGFVAGLMVLRTFKPRASAKSFYELVNPDPIFGTQTPRLVRALRASGIGVSVRERLDFQGVHSAIEGGLPIICTVGTQDRNVRHWVVIYGVGVKPKRVFVAGTGFLTGTIFSWREFRNIWAARGNGLVCWGR